MAVTFVLGRSGSGKSSFCFDRIEQHIKNQEQVLYLVPEQMSFQTEYELIRRTNGVLFGTQVLGFKRLAIRILQETGGLSRELIDTQALRLLIRKLIFEHQDELRVFTKERISLGLLDEIIGFIQETSNALIDLQTLQELPAGNQLLSDKLHDLALLSEQLTLFLGEQYVLDADYYRLLAEHIQSSDWLKQTHIYVDGFHSLNEQEYVVLEQIMKYAGSTTIQLTLDKAYTTKPEQHHLFSMPAGTFLRLQAGAKAVGVATSVKMMPEPRAVRFKQAPDLAALETYLYAGKREPLQQDSISITPFVDRKDELDGVAQQIRLLVQNGARYGQIAVYVPQKALYADSIRSIFSLYEIPYFLDTKEAMLYHPFLEFIHASISLIKNSWATSEMLRVLKSGFLGVSSDEAARIELFCQLYGKTGRKDWLSETPWVWHTTKNSFIDGVDEEKSHWIEAMRQKIIQPLLEFEALFKGEQQIVQVLSGMMQWLSALHITEQLQTLADESQDLVQVRRHQAVWQQFSVLLEQYVQVAGNDVLPMDEFLSIFETGIESLQFAVIPPSFDQVLVGDFERSRFQMASSASNGAYSLGIEYAFVLGVNEGDVPQVQTDTGIIHDDERRKLQAFDVELATAQSHLQQQQFGLYTVLTSPSKQLAISYLLADGINGETEKNPSYIIHSLKYLGVQEYPVGGDFAFGKTLPAAIPQFTRALKVYQQTGNLNANNQSIYNYIKTHHQSLLASIQASLFFNNRTVALDAKLLEARFGKTLRGSVSSFETYYSCPFQYYTKQILRIEEPKQASVQANVFGLLFHQCIEYISQVLSQEHRQFSQLQNNEINQFVDAYLNQHAPLAQFGIFMQSARSQYFIKKVRKTLIQTLQMLAFQDTHSQFKQQFSEVRFGGAGKLPAQVYSIDAEHDLQVSGVIDRVDQVLQNNQQYWRIIDYKSSRHTFSFTDMYYGLNLQMPTYMDVLLSNYPESKNAGMLYFAIDQSMKQTSDAILDAEKVLQSSYTMNGFVLDDPQVAQSMDDTLITSERSVIIPAKLKNDGQFDKSKSSIMSESDFTTLIDYTKTKYQSGGGRIWQGDIDITPVQESGKDVPKPCAHCKFRSICQLDRYLNKPQIITNKNKAEALAQMALEVKDDDSK